MVTITLLSPLICYGALPCAWDMLEEGNHDDFYKLMDLLLTGLIYT